MFAKASGLPEAAPHVFETPILSPSQKVARYFEQLTSQDAAILPFHEKSSPGKRRKSPGHDVVKHISFLYHNHRDLLSPALEAFRLRSPTLLDNDAKLNDLLDRLTVVVTPLKGDGTPRSSPRRHVAPSSLQEAHAITSMGPPANGTRSKTSTPTSIRWPPPSLQSSQLKDYPAPPSPTLSVKHAPKPLLDDIAKYPQLPVSMAASKFPTDLNISFTTTGGDSFWSSNGGSQEPVSPATSIDSFHSLDRPMTDGANELPNDSQIFFSSPCQPSSTAKTKSTASATVGTTQSDYGDFPSSMAQLEQNAASKSSKTDQPPTSHQIDNTSKILPQTSEKQPKPAGNSEKEVPSSPSKPRDEHIRITNIPTHGIAGGGLKLSQNLLKLPWDLRFECARIMSACSLSSHELEQLWPAPRDWTTLHKIAKQRAPPTFHFRSKASDTGCSYHVNLRYTESKGPNQPLFEPELLASNNEMLTSFQRTFGYDRLLSVDTDSLHKLPTKLGFKGQQEYIIQRFLQMLGQEQEFLGRRWLQFLVKTKDSKRGGLADVKQHGAYSFTFIALSGDSGTLPPLDLRTVINWALPIAENADALWCKIYARLDLRASRNVRVGLIARDNIEEIDDLYATDESAPIDRNDPRYEQQFKANAEFKGSVIMTDGSSANIEVLLRLCGNALGLTYVPSAIQFRCGGAKGMIFQNTDNDEDDEALLASLAEVKISLSKSQRKLIFKSLQAPSTVYDEEFFELSANRASRPTGSSYLYLDFLSILHDRGVPAENIEKLAMRHIDAYTKSLFEAIEGPEALRRWLHTQGAVMQDRRRDNDIPTVAGFPSLDIEKAIYMLEAGFQPTKFLPLAELIDSEIKQSAERMIRKFKITLDQSTMVLGVADPTRTLGPGEAYLSLSTPMLDSKGRTITHMTGWALLSRLPAARGSDIRCVSFRYVPELSHLRDVLVLSTRGVQPLADMCSGGDYDGDQFWVCREPLLVKPFRNAPAPRELPDPRTLGIKVDERRLGEIVTDPNDEEQVRNFIRMGTANRMQQSWVGIVTKLHARVVHEYGLSSEQAIACTDLKDRLMDSEKNGFSFDNDAFEAFKQNWNLCRLPLEPAYFKYTDKKAPDAKDPEEIEDSKQYQKSRPTNIIDRIYVDTLACEFENAANAVRAKLNAATIEDADLFDFYEKMMEEGRRDPVIRAELTHLLAQLSKLCQRWGKTTHNWGEKHSNTRKKNDTWYDIVLDCCAFYQDIQPLAVSTNPAIAEWCRGNGYALTTWERLKASAFAKTYFLKASAFAKTFTKGKFLLSIAGAQLCQLKAEATPGSRLMTNAAYKILKPRTLKRKRDDDERDNGEEQDEMDVFYDMDAGGGAEM